jgi:hypothetical protein
MRFEFTRERQAFRQELRDFLVGELGTGRGTGGSDRAFSKKLAERGWMASPGRRSTAAGASARSSR